MRFPEVKIDHRAVQRHYDRRRAGICNAAPQLRHSPASLGNVGLSFRLQRPDRPTTIDLNDEGQRTSGRVALKGIVGSHRRGER